MEGRIARFGVLAFVFITVFVTLYSIMPSEFFFSVSGVPSKSVPDYWHGLSLYEFNFTGFWDYNITGGVVEDYDELFQIGARHLGLGYGFDILGDGDLRLYHRYGFLNLFHEDMFWYNQANELRSWTGGVWQNEYMNIDDIVEDYAEFGESAGSDYKVLRYTVVNEGVNSGFPFDLLVMFSYNQTAYDTAKQARNAGDLMILAGITSENEGTAVTAYDTLINLLTFNTLGLFGSSSSEVIALNWILAAPFYICVVFICVAIFLEVLPL